MTVDPADRTPLYEQVAQSLRREIVARRLEAGTRLPEIGQLAAAAQVSVGTMEKALRRLIASGVCVRRPKHGTFVGVLPGAEAGVRRMAGILSLAPEEESCPIHARLLAGMRASAAEDDIDLVTLPPSGETLASYAGDGRCVWLGTAILYWDDRDRVAALLARYPAMRFVFVNYDCGEALLEPGRVGAVLNDEFAGGFELGMALYRRGHRRVSVLSVDLPNCNYRRRIDGVAAVGRVLNDPAWEVRVASVPAGGEIPQEQRGRELAREVLSVGAPPTALVALNDLLAFGAAQAASKQVEVVGYDHVIPELSRLGGFSTVEIDFDRIGFCAVKMLAGALPETSTVLRVAPVLLPQWRATL